MAYELHSTGSSYFFVSLIAPNQARMTHREPAASLLPEFPTIIKNVYAYVYIKSCHGTFEAKHVRLRSNPVFSRCFFFFFSNGAFHVQILSLRLSPSPVEKKKNFSYFFRGLIKKDWLSFFNAVAAALALCFDHVLWWLGATFQVPHS